MEKNFHMTLLRNSKVVSNHWAFSSDPGTDESPRGLNPGHIAGYGRRLTPAGQFQGLYRKHDLQGRFEIIFMFSPGESLSPTENLTNSRNSMSSLDVKRCFEVMAIKHCCEVTTQHNVFKFSGNDAETAL